MSHFQVLDLPPELLPVVLSSVLSQQHLYVLCLVNKLFNIFATPLLYRRAFIFAWYKDSKTKVGALFETLSRCPRLAHHVERLGESSTRYLASSISHSVLAEIRDFPKGLPAEIQSDLLQICTQGIRNCVNLRSCAWSRDGSLHSVVLESLSSCPRLHELEINGNDRIYDPILLTRFSRLSKISLIMPSSHVLDVLPTWISVTGETLCSLTIICKASSYVSDTFLSRLASNLQGLEYLSIIGCPKVTHEGIGVIASANRKGLLGIGLEGLSQAFDMSAFRSTCLSTNAFRQLRAVTLTVQIHVPMSDWAREVGDLLSSSPLEAFSIYSTSASTWVIMPDQFWIGIVAEHGHRLKRFSFHRIQINLATLEEICRRCPLLEQLFIVVEQHELPGAVDILALAKNLRTLHINLLPATFGSTIMSPPSLMRIALSIVSLCSPTLAQIGCNTRVWQVKGIVRLDERGEKYVVRELQQYESPDVPEQFLVVRV